MRRVWLVVMACVCTGACRLSIHGELIDCGVGAKMGIGANMDLFTMIALGASHACATRYIFFPLYTDPEMAIRFHG